MTNWSITQLRSTRARINRRNQAPSSSTFFDLPLDIRCCIFDLLDPFSTRDVGGIRFSCRQGFADVYNMQERFLRRLIRHFNLSGGFFGEPVQLTYETKKAKEKQKAPTLEEESNPGPIVIRKHESENTGSFQFLHEVRLTVPVPEHSPLLYGQLHRHADFLTELIRLRIHCVTVHVQCQTSNAIHVQRFVNMIMNAIGTSESKLGISAFQLSWGPSPVDALPEQPEVWAGDVILWRGKLRVFEIGDKRSREASEQMRTKLQTKFTKNPRTILHRSDDGTAGCAITIYPRDCAMDRASYEPGRRPHIRWLQALHHAVAKAVYEHDLAQQKQRVVALAHSE